jgi:hypothetical protein
MEDDRKAKERHIVHARGIDAALPSPSLRRTYVCVSAGMVPPTRQLATIGGSKSAKNK